MRGPVLAPLLAAETRETMTRSLTEKQVLRESVILPHDLGALTSYHCGTCKP